MKPETIVEKLVECITDLPEQEAKAGTFWSMLEAAQIELALAIDSAARLAMERPEGDADTVRTLEYETLNGVLNAASMLGVALRHFPNLGQLEIDLGDRDVPCAEELRG